MWAVSHHCPIRVFGFFCVFVLFFLHVRVLPAEGLGRRGEGHIQMHVGWGSPPGHLQACFLTGFGPSCRGERRNPGRAGDRPQVVSGCFFPSSLFSADQFVVSVSTEVSGRFSEMKILFFFRGMVEGATGRRSGHSPKIF